MAELSAQPTVIQSVYAWYSDNKLFVNRRYQRKLVWTLAEKQKLIESILKKYPIPAILLAERKGAPGTYEIIDGLQRLHAIVSFIDTSFPTIDGKTFDLTHFPTAKSRADKKLFVPNVGKALLNQKDVSTILDYSLALSVMRNASEAEINDVFDRINTYGHRLSDQERRQAGIQNEFSTMVRLIACTLRGDESADILPLEKMPSISIDLPMAKHGYEVKAEDVFWVEQGILRSTDLRDSMDEQCIADIAACIVSGSLIERSKDALDEIYSPVEKDSASVETALGVYGSEKFTEEFKYCVDEILKVCATGTKTKLRNLIFGKNTTNAFPSIFATLMIAFHELIIKEGMKITDYAGAKAAMNRIADDRLASGKKGTSSVERRKNVDTVKGLLIGYFVKAMPAPKIYGGHATTDIEAAVRRSEVELADYELKQGLLTLAAKRGIDSNIFAKVINTICAIANNGVGRDGKIIIGVSDKDADTQRIVEVDKIKPKKVGKRFVVGVQREADFLKIPIEQYFAKWKDAIKNSDLSSHLKGDVMSNIDFNSFYGLGIIVIQIPAQKELSYVGEKAFWRNGDSTEEATTAKKIAELAKRF